MIDSTARLCPARGRMLLTNTVADIAIRAALLIIVLFLSLVTFLPNLILRR